MDSAQSDRDDDPGAMAPDPGEPRPPEASASELVLMVEPSDANALGVMHGGRLLYLMDEVGGICAMRHAHRPVVTVAMDEVVFHQPLPVGQAVVLEARLNWVGRTSMEVEVTVWSEDLLADKRLLTTTAYLTYVALDENRRPAPVPPLELATEEDRERFAAGEARHRERLARQAARAQNRRS
ncbi:MAG: acyl-CoA thioesterase [Bacillota bacterium]|nr:acyl-CoA thioesterase [Bacillota bacterium]